MWVFDPAKGLGYCGNWVQGNGGDPKVDTHGGINLSMTLRLPRPPAPKFYYLRKSRSIAFQKRGLEVACPPEEPIPELGAGPQTP